MGNKQMRKIILVLVSFCCFSTGAAWAGEDLFDEKGARVLFNKGMKCLATRQYDAAIDALEESSAVNPLAETFYYLGYAYYLKGKKGDANSTVKSVENFDRAYELDPGFTPIKEGDVVEAKSLVSEATDSSQPAKP